MRRATMLALLALTLLTVSAQQQLWGGAKGSPHVNSDNTVTFSIKAPDAQRVSHWSPICTYITMWLMV